MKALTLLLSLVCPVAAWAQASTPEPAVATSGAYVSGMFGNGKVNGGNTTGDKKMKWRAQEYRFGRELNTTFPNLGGHQKIRIDFMYYNEGHPENNHRDGFGAQLVYTHALSDILTAELGAGPDFTMNTTTIGGEEINDAHVGLLLSLALRIGLDQYSPGLHLRIGYNHVAMRDVHSSNALLFGIGKYFAATPPYPAKTPFWIGAAVGSSITNQANTDSAFGFSVEAKQYWGPWAASIAVQVEGDDGSRVDRQGIAAQAWFVQPLTDKWTVSAGLGPYVAKNDREPAGDTHVLGLITLQAERSISKTAKVFASFSRVKTFREENDRDLFRIGLMSQFGAW